MQKIDAVANGIGSTAHKASGKVRAASAAVVTTALVASGSAMAQSTSSFLDGGVSGMFTQLKTDITSLLGMAWPVKLFIVGSLIGITIFSKVARKAT